MDFKSRVYGILKKDEQISKIQNDCTRISKAAYMDFKGRIQRFEKDG